MIPRSACPPWQPDTGNPPCSGLPRKRCYTTRWDTIRSQWSHSTIRQHMPRTARSDPSRPTLPTRRHAGRSIAIGAPGTLPPAGPSGHSASRLSIPKSRTIDTVTRPIAAASVRVAPPWREAKPATSGAGPHSGAACNRTTPIGIIVCPKRNRHGGSLPAAAPKQMALGSRNPYGSHIANAKTVLARCRKALSRPSRI